MPSSGVLTTKLAPPRSAGGAVRRARLHARLDALPAAGLAVVTGAPGAGKTSLLADWAATCPDAVAWVSIDVDDNDAAQLWSAVHTSVAAALTDPISPADSTAPIGPGARADAVLRLVEDRIGERRLWLVLDDLHHIHDRTVLDQLGRLVRRQPAGMRTVVVSRVDPAIGVAALRVQGRVVDLTDDDLRFTEAETEMVLREEGIELDPEALATLVHRTDGWAAGVRLALHAMHGTDRPAEFVARFGGTQRAVADFLLEEGLGHQSDDVRAFLLETAVLDDLTAALCDAVRERTDSLQLLREIERRHLFVQRLETFDGAPWYRLNDLFRVALLGELSAADADAPGRLRRRAAAWLDAHGQPVEAIRQHLAADDTDAAAAAILRVEGDLLQRGWADTLCGWYEQLPQEVQPDEMRLLRLFWAAVFVDNLTRAELVLGQLRHATPADRSVDLPTEITLAEAFLAFRRGDMRATLELADAAAEGYAAFGEAGLGGSAHAIVLGAEARMHLGDSAQAEARLRAFLATAGHHDDLIGRRARAALAAAVAKQGRYAEALALAADALGPEDPTVVRPRALPEAWLAIAGAHLSQGRIDLVDGDVERARTDASSFLGGPVYAVIAHELVANARWQAGDVADALAGLDAALLRADEHGVGHDVTRRIHGRRDEWRELVRERSSVPQLTAREHEVLMALTSYRSLQEIADDLFVSLNTMKSHLKGIYGKLGVSSRNDAVRKAIDLALIQPQR